MATKPTGSGLSVTPAILQLKLASNQRTVNFNETVTNISNLPLIVNAKSQDFHAGGISGSADFYPSSYPSFNNMHRLAGGVKITPSHFGIQPGESQTIGINISNANSLAPGGHYGAIIYTPQVLGNSSITKIDLVPSVASLVFLTTASGGYQTLTLNNIQLSRFTLSLPRTVSFIVNNSGNTQSTPIGYAKVISPYGQLQAQQVLNHNSLMVLPDSSILMTVNLPAYGSLWSLPGMYNLKITYGYSGSATLSTVSYRFFYLSPLLAGLLLVVLIIIIFIVWWHKSKRHRKAARRIQIEVQHD